MFRDICVKDFKENIIDIISKEYMLITAGNGMNYNMMTASWGFMGEMWGEDSVAVVVRPSRYTMEFLDNNEYFTLTFFGDNKDIHKICGSKTGREVNKTSLTGLTPVSDGKCVWFDEARLVFKIKKKYVQPMSKEFLTDKSVDEKWYGDGDWHNLIIGSIERIYVKE
ncbi:MAG: flavin reductase family protein [Acutalibacteraceae bacterium]|nr:flavin reductase family protein [Acutalibacteraceae bacterium]